MKRIILIVSTVALLLTQLAWSQGDECRKSHPDKEISDRCRTKETCRECIVGHPCCAWCTDKDFGGQRCDYLSAIEKYCNGSYMFPTKKFRKTKDEPLSAGSSTEDAIQIKPQKVYIELKPNVSVSFKIQYKQAGDYPLDLYYLMDLSHTMADDKDNLAKLGDMLAEKMKKTTRKFQLGFGSFVDKVTLPFTDTHPGWLSSVCHNCAVPYTFRNHMALNKDTGRFKKEVALSRISANTDAPEGALDALMQAIVCKDEIKWRENSRKLLVLATDETYHVAGDGKLGGVVRPNDGKCHLNATGFHTEGLRLDYPSVGQIRKAILKNRVNVIFAATTNKLSVYKSLSDRLDGSTVGELSADSSNVVEMIQEQYNKITSSVKLVHDAKDPTKVTFYSSCSGAKKETDVCEGISLGGSVSFDAEIKITSCPKDRNEWNQTFQIYPLGINEHVTVDLRMLCECDCEKPWNLEVDNDYCSAGNGTFECGICRCNENRSGKRCQCETTDGGVTTDVEDVTACFKPNDTVECSGKGSCVCGRCECIPHENPEHKTTGQFCECDNFSCDRHNRLLCGGPDQGKCECGVCKCLPGWEGKVCECPNSNEMCINPEDEEVCSGHGECECGVCICKQTDKEYYTGKFCEKCVVCPGNCERYKACVQCKIFQSGPLTKEECDKCPGNYTVVKELEENTNQCYFVDDDECRFVFTYKMKENSSIIIEVKEEKECPKPVNVLAIVLGTIGGIVAIGIATLLAWKLLTHIHDSREYAKFMEERKLAKWKIGQNPLFKNATTTFQNPSFGSR